MSRARPQRIIGMKPVISLASIALVLMTAGGVHLLSEHNARRALEREMESRLVLEARYLALLATEALLAEFPELTLCPIVRELKQRRPDLDTAVVLDHEGKVRGHSDVRRLGEQFTGLADLTPRAAQVLLEGDEQVLINDQVVAAKVPARHPGGQIVGTALVSQKRDHLDRMLSAGRDQVSLLAAAMALIGAALALVVVHRLLAPLDILRAGLERIGRGVLDRPIGLRNRTELGLLGGAIDDMADQLRQAQVENRAREQEIIDTQRELVHTLSEVVESRSHETGNHICRVAEGAALLASLAGLPPEECELLRLAAPMHDVGKIGIPDAILNKPGRLTPHEFALIQTHTRQGYQILAQSSRPILKAAAMIALQHHERWDGAGYPQGLAGLDIHIFGRIVAIVDVYDALTTDRCYRSAMPLAEALAIMNEGRGGQFDPDLLDLFLSHLGRFRDLQIPEQSGAERAALASAAAPAQTEPQEELLPVG